MPSNTYIYIHSIGAKKSVLRVVFCLCDGLLKGIKIAVYGDQFGYKEHERGFKTSRVVDYCVSDQTSNSHQTSNSRLLL